MIVAADRLLAELEQHVRRVIEHPEMNSLNVMEQRGALANELERYIDARIDEKLNTFFKEMKRVGMFQQG